ncbi:MAG TPA: AMP-binding protein [Solimonas sp.]|nr:AMP-binding protein [Solimonas sp.]
MSLPSAVRRDWLSQYPAGVPATIATPAAACVSDLLAEACWRHAERIAVVCGDEQLSYYQLAAHAERLAAFLTADLGLARGERVAVMMPNISAYPVAVLGILSAGCAAVNVNPLYTPRELKHQLCDSGARAILIAEPFLATLDAVLAETPVQTVIVVPAAALPAPSGAWAGETRLPLATALATMRPLPTIELGLGDTAFLQYTGGTTGVSKGAELTHGNILSNIAQIDAWFGGVLQESRETAITALPLYHIFALMLNLLYMLRMGGTTVLISNPRDLPGVVGTMARHPFSVFTGVNTLYNGLLNTSGFADLDFSSLRMSMGGGAAVQPAVARRWQEVTGRVLLEGYGLSETSPVLTINRVDSKGFRGGIGLPLPSTEISIRNEQGAEVAVGEAGELCARGPQVMRGYWQRPEETAKVFTADGYFRTGDMARQDEEGYFHIVDRVKDMVLVSGFNVYPNEIEAVCAEHPGVLESACIGVPDDKTGEAVKIFVVRRDESLDAPALIEHCRRNLTGYKVPRHVEFIAALPKSPVGKILRRELRG